jgi:hypothetical protein
MPRPCQHLSDNGETKIFSSRHLTIKGCNCWQWPGLIGGKRAILSTSMFSSWLCGYWPSCLRSQHAPCDSYNPPQLPALWRYHVHQYNCLLWVDRECQEAHGSFFSLHTIAVKTPLVFTRMSPHFNISVLSLSSLDIPFLCSLTVPQQEFFSGASHQTVQGRK